MTNDLTYKQQLEYLKESWIGMARGIIGNEGNCVPDDSLCPLCPIRIKCKKLKLDKEGKVRYALEYLFSEDFTPTDLLEDVF